MIPPIIYISISASPGLIGKREKQSAACGASLIERPDVRTGRNASYATEWQLEAKGTNTLDILVLDDRKKLWSKISLN